MPALACRPQNLHGDIVNSLLRRAGQVIDILCEMARWLVIPLVVLLFVQWPLRDLVHGWSREANDLAQCIFALYVAIALTAATRKGAHLASDVLAHRYGFAWRRRLEVALILLGLMPWSLFLLLIGWPSLIVSLRGLEAFADSGNPGYFVIRASGFLLAALVFASGLLGLGQRPA